ncbi:MAG: hypothetical protein ACFFDT_11910 [Candidatus Hodarchaeota archaeon]
MPCQTKIRVCTETEKRKAEIFNKIDKLLAAERWNEASNQLQYLYRNAPSVRTQVQRKLVRLYLELKNYQKSLTYLQDLIPSTDTSINRMVIECLLQLNNEDQALLHLARAPLPSIKKRDLFFLIFPELQEIHHLNKMDLVDSQVTLRCPRCTQFLFFVNNKPKCLFCEIAK